jgi:ferritin-like metal-binding protein YciE
MNALVTEPFDDETVRVCRRIVRDEERMSRWLERNLPRTVRETVELEA